MVSLMGLVLCSEKDAKIGDFGLSVKVEALNPLVGMHAPGCCKLDVSAIGSLYSAPELGSDGGYDSSVDVFSLGMILFAIFANCRDIEELVSAVEAMKTPQSGDDGQPRSYEDTKFGAYSVLHSIGEPMKSTIIACLARDSTARPSATEVHARVAGKSSNTKADSQTGAVVTPVVGLDAQSACCIVM